MKFRKWSKREASQFEAKYHLLDYSSFVLQLLNKIEELIEKVEQGRLSEEKALPLLDRIFEKLKDLRDSEIFKLDERYKVPVYSVMQAEKLSLCLEEPKMTVEELLNLPEDEFNSLYLKLEQFLADKARIDNSLLDDLEKILRETENKYIPSKEILIWIEDLRRQKLSKDEFKKKLNLV